MKKMFVLLSTLIFAFALTSCFADVDSLEWVTLPDSVYIQGSATLDSIKNDVKIKINNQVYTLAQALGLPEVTVSGFNTDKVGRGLITITYKSLTIYYAYDVVEKDTKVPEPVEPTYDWYVGQSSPYTLGSVSDLYGFAHIVNGTAKKMDNTPIERDTFAGKVVKLGVDIDLSDKVWTPIGESARKQNVEKTFADLGTSGGNRPQATETEAQYIARLNALPKTLTKYVYLGNYFFAEKISDTSYKYWQSDQALDANKFFAGTFDGQNHKIKGLSDVGYTPRTAIVYANSSLVLQGYTFGFFGTVQGNVTVKNITFEDVTINGAYYNSGNNELVTAEIDSVGVVIGYTDKVDGKLEINNVKVLSGSISAFAAAGGLVGRLYHYGETLIQNCENRASVTVSENHAGGIVGFIGDNNRTGQPANKVEFINNDNYGNITAVSGAGAMLRNSNVKVVFTNCRNFGNISVTNQENGMVGINPTRHTYLGCLNYGKLN